MISLPSSRSAHSIFGPKQALNKTVTDYLYIIWRQLGHGIAPAIAVALAVMGMRGRVLVRTLKFYPKPLPDFSGVVIYHLKLANKTNTGSAILIIKIIHLLLETFFLLARK